MIELRPCIKCKEHVVGTEECRFCGLCMPWGLGVIELEAARKMAAENNKFVERFRDGKA